MYLVMDACASASLVLPDESSATAERVIASLGPDDRILVPHLWWYEMSNILAGALRRMRLHEADVAVAWNLITALGPETDSRLGPMYGMDLDRLAAAHSLSAYDAAYLELAMREGASLLSFDKSLCSSAVQAGVTVLS